VEQQLEESLAVFLVVLMQKQTEETFGAVKNG
jgi:hypothetical protein